MLMSKKRNNLGFQILENQNLPHCSNIKKQTTLIIPCLTMALFDANSMYFTKEFIPLILFADSKTKPHESVTKIRVGRDAAR